MNSDEADSFRGDHPVAWQFHRNTSRWLHNTLDAGLDGADIPQAPKEHPSAPFVPFPAAVPGSGRTALDDLIHRRGSCRSFRDEAVPLADLGAVLAAGYGVDGAARLGALEFLERPVPSGGGLYPLELYVLARAIGGVEPGVYHYAPVVAGLEQLRTVELPSRFVSYLFMGQPVAAQAACVVVMTAVVSRSMGKYGDRGYRYLLLEAGHVGQNLGLAALERDLGTCSLGGFFDDELAALLTIDIDLEIPLYAIALGPPTSPDRHKQRAFDGQE